MNKLMILSVFFISFNLIAHSGGSESHGGNTVVCYDQELYTKNQINPNASIVGNPILYDFWEHSELSFYKLANFKGNEFEIIDHILEKFSKVDINKSKYLKQRFKNFHKDFKFISRAVIPEVKDFIPNLLPDEANFCYRRQTAFQRSKRRIKEAKFFIDKKIYDKMNNINKAGLILHELIYENSLEYPSHYIRGNKKDLYAKADRARHLNFLLFSDFMTEPALTLNYFTVLIESRYYKTNEKQLAFFNNLKASFYLKEPRYTKNNNQIVYFYDTGYITLFNGEQMWINEKKEWNIKFER